MFRYISQKIKTYKIIKSIKDQADSNGSGEYESLSQLTGSLIDDVVTIREKAGNSADLVIRELVLDGVSVNVISCEGMTDLLAVSRFILEPLRALRSKLRHKLKFTPADIYFALQKEAVAAADLNTAANTEDIFSYIMSGFTVVLVDGVAAGIAIGTQGFPVRSVEEPSGEANIRGSREGFVESVRLNMALVRKRVKSPKLRFDMIKIGETGKTDVCLAYIEGTASKKLVEDTRRKLNKVKVDMLLDSGYLQPFLETRSFNMFSEVGITERPDTLAAKLSEGRIGVIVDGTPFVLVFPFLFVENFHSLDDYSHKPYYSTFTRLLKWTAFFVTVFLPGLYVAVVNFHPQILPNEFLFNIMSAETNTHLPIMIEALVIHLVYEIMREAGLRLPRPIGHAVSIVGALVIGDAAVSAGIIAAPMIMIVAMTALSAFVIAPLYESVSVLKFIFIFFGGIFGLYGIALGFLMLLTQICALNNFGIPYFSPVSPFSFKNNRDVFIRASWRVLGQKNIEIGDLPGADERE
ncbi:MAG: spore germination protein [Oscillospiraceae bacterium]|nr:spore germination protein [Oscillospiraceae bacterium]